MQKVNKDGPVHPVLLTKCWLWGGYVFEDGYGGIMVNWIMYRAHRLSWVIHNGEIPPGLQVLHHCDTPLCVNPLHLFLGTSADNKKDCTEKDRHARGERHGEHKLTDDMVREIRRTYRKGVRGFGATSLARRFGVSKPIILGVVNLVAWKHVTCESST